MGRDASAKTVVRGGASAAAVVASELRLVICVCVFPSSLVPLSNSRWSNTSVSNFLAYTTTQR